MKKLSSVYLNLFSNTIARDLIFRLLRVPPNQPMEEYFSAVSEIIETAKNNLQGALRNQLIDFIDLYAQGQIYRLSQDAAQKAKQVFQEFLRLISSKDLQSISNRWLKKQAQDLSPLAFSFFINEALLFLKNHREMIHTPTWYGEYVSYSEPYRILRARIDKAQESALNLEDFSNTLKSWCEQDKKINPPPENHESSWLKRAQDILFSPLTLTVTMAFLFRFPVAKAASTTPNEILAGELYEEDTFQINSGTIVEIQDFEPSWKTDSGEQFSDTLDISSMWHGPGAIKITQEGRDTEWEFVHHATKIIFKNFRAEHFCLAPEKEFNDLFFQENRGIRNHFRIMRDCRDVTIPLLRFPGIPFINLSSFKAVNFGEFAAMSKGLLHSRTRLTFRTDFPLDLKYLSHGFTCFMKKNAFPIFFINSKTESMEINLLPKQRFIIFYDWPQKNTLIRASSYQRNNTSALASVFRVQAGDESLEFRNVNPIFLCSRDTVSRILDQDDQIMPAFIDCSALHFPHEQENALFSMTQGPDSAYCKEAIGGDSNHQVIIACDKSELDLSTSKKTTVHIRGARNVSLVLGEKPLEATVHEFMTEGEAHSRLTIQKTGPITVKISSKDEMETHVQIAETGQTLSLISTSPSFFCDPLNGRQFFQVPEPDLLNLDCSQLPYWWSTAGKADLLKIKAKETKIIMRWNPEWSSQTGYQAFFDSIDISELEPGKSEMVLLKFSEHGNDTHLSIMISPINTRFVDIIFKDIPIRNFCFAPRSKKFIVPEIGVFHEHCINAYQRLHLLPNTPFVNLEGYEAITFKPENFYHDAYETGIRITDTGRLTIHGHIRPEFFNLRMYQFLKANPMRVYHVTPKTKSMALTFPAFNESMKLPPALVLFDFSEPNLLMLAFEHHNNTFKIDTGTGTDFIEFTGENLEWLCKSPGISISRVGHEFLQTFIDCSLLGIPGPNFAPLIQEELLRDSQKLQNYYFKILSPALENQCIPEGRLLLLQNIKFETNAPWITLKITTRPLGKLVSYLTETHSNFMRWQYSDDQILLESVPGIIRRFLVAKRFLIKDPRETTQIDLEFSIAQEYTPQRARVVLHICNYGVLPNPTNTKIQESALLLLWQNGGRGILFTLLGSILAISAGIISLRALNRVMLNRILQKMRIILAELNIPECFQEELSRKFADQHFYTICGRRTFFPKSGIRDVCSNRPFEATRNEAERRIREFELPKDSPLKEEELNECLLSVDEEERQESKTLLLETWKDFKIEIEKNPRLCLLSHLQNHNFFSEIKLKNIVKEFILDNKKLSGVKEKRANLQAKFRYLLFAVLLLNQPVYDTVRDQLRLSGLRKTIFNAARSLEELESFHQQIREGKINLSEELSTNEELLDALNQWINLRSPVFSERMRPRLGIADHPTYQQLFDLCLKEYEYRFKLQKATPAAEINNNNLLSL